jgi:pimeloyl-ACP methyl ester carboxylesterase
MGYKFCLFFVMLIFSGNACASKFYVPNFEPCKDAASVVALAGTQCKLAWVPLNYDPLIPSGGESLLLFTRKFPALKTSQGTVWLIAGGPGESGASLYPSVAQLRKNFPDFDLLVPDHRGTGFSSRLCSKEEAPESEGGAALSGAEWGTCFGHLIANPAYAGQFSLTNAARDLRNMIEGERSSSRQQYVYAVSYGTQLVSRAQQTVPRILYFGPRQSAANTMCASTSPGVQVQQQCATLTRRIMF